MKNLRSVGGGVEIGGANIGGVANGRSEGNSDGTLGLRTGDGRRDPG